MKKLLIVIVILLILSGLAFAKLSDETLEEVDKLWWKHHGLTATTDNILTINPFDYSSWYMWFEDGKLFIETQDGKWFIEMKEVKE